MTNTEFLDSIKTNNAALLSATEANANAFFSTEQTPETLSLFFGRRAVTNYLMLAFHANDLKNKTEDTALSYVQLYVLEKESNDALINLSNHYSGVNNSISDLSQNSAANPTTTGRKLLGEYMDNRLHANLFCRLANESLIKVINQMLSVTTDSTLTQYLNIVVASKTRSLPILEGKLLELLVDQTAQDDATSIIDSMRKQLFEVSQSNTVDLEASRNLVNQTYGWTY